MRAKDCDWREAEFIQKLLVEGVPGCGSSHCRIDWKYSEKDSLMVNFKCEIEEVEEENKPHPAFCWFGESAQFRMAPGTLFELVLGM